MFKFFIRKSLPQFLTIFNKTRVIALQKFSAGRWTLAFFLPVKRTIPATHFPSPPQLAKNAIEILNTTLRFLFITILVWKINKWIIFSFRITT